VSGFGSWQHTHKDYNKSDLFMNRPRSFPYQLQMGHVKFSNQCHCVQFDKGIDNRFSLCSFISRPKYHQLFFEYLDANFLCSSTDASSNFSKAGIEDSGGPLFFNEEEISKDFHRLEYAKELIQFRFNKTQTLPKLANTSRPALLGIVLRNVKRNNKTFSYYLDALEYDDWISSVILLHGDSCTLKEEKQELGRTLITEESADENKKRITISMKELVKYCVERTVIESISNSDACGYDEKITESFWEQAYA